eukprot:3840955-Rhodomonas_salina.2
MREGLAQSPGYPASPIAGSDTRRSVPPSTERTCRTPDHLVLDQQPANGHRSQVAHPWLEEGKERGADGREAKRTDDGN